MGAAAEDVAGAGAAVADRAGLRGRRVGHARWPLTWGSRGTTVRKWRVAVPGGPAGGPDRRAAARGRRGRSPTSRSSWSSPRRWTERGPGEDTHWSTRSMAGSTGMSQSAVSRIWRAFGLKPHIVQTWKLSHRPAVHRQGPRRRRPLHDPAGERPGPGGGREVARSRPWTGPRPCLPMLPTTPARMTHDYVRHGTTSLFAAFDLASGSVIAQPYRRHRHQEFLRFLKLIDAAVPKDLDLHLVLDNYATHKTPAIKKWLLQAPPVPPALHPDQLLVAEPGRALVRRAHQPQAPPLSPPQRHRARNRHPQVDQRVEQGPQAVRVDQDRRRDPRNPRRLLRTNQRLRTLVVAPVNSSGVVMRRGAGVRLDRAGRGGSGAVEVVAGEASSRRASRLAL